MQVEVRAVPVPASLRGESRVAALHGTLVKKVQMDVLEVLLQLKVVRELLPALDASVRVLLVDRNLVHRNGTR